MYRFDSIEDYTKAFEISYIDGLEKDAFTDFEAVAMLAMYDKLKSDIGYIEGLLHANEVLGASDPESTTDIALKTAYIEQIVEVTTKRLEELGLL